LEELMALLLANNLSLTVDNFSFRLASASRAEKSYNWLQSKGRRHVPPKA
jgi:hypothetical protein